MSTRPEVRMWKQITSLPWLCKPVTSRQEWPVEHIDVFLPEQLDLHNTAGCNQIKLVLQVSSWSPVLPSVTKRQKVEESPSADSVSFASELEILLASTLQSSPSLAKVSIYSHVTDLLSRVNQFLTLDGPSKKQRTSVFADVCVVFTNWLQRTNAFPEELLLAVWLADSIWRYSILRFADIVSRFMAASFLACADGASM